MITSTPFWMIMLAELVTGIACLLIGFAIGDRKG